MSDDFEEQAEPSPLDYQDSPKVGSDLNSKASGRGFESDNRRESSTFEKFNLDRIIVAEDQVINIQVFKNQLNDLGLADKTTFCRNGQETIDTVRDILTTATDAKPISIILTDF